MSSSEIRQYILELAEQNNTKLAITSEVMRKYGTIYHYSFKEWCRIVSEELHYSQTDVLNDGLIDDEDIISPKEIHSTQDLDCDINEKEPRTEKEESAKDGSATKFSVTAIDYFALKNNGLFKVTFGDSYEVSDILLKNVFQRMLFHIGFMRVKELDIKVNSCPLIMYIFHNHFNYEKCLPYSSYYIYKMNDEQMVETICEIIKRLQIEAIIEKGNNIILKSFLISQSSLGAEVFPSKEHVNSKERNNQIQKTQSNNIDLFNKERPVQLKKISKPSHSKSLDNSKNLDLSKFKHKDLLPLLPLEVSNYEKSNIFKRGARQRIKVNTKDETQVGLTAQQGTTLNNKLNLQVYIDKIKEIQVKYKKGKLVPHIPIFILTLLELIDNGSIKKNQFKLDSTMRLTYLKLWDRHSYNEGVYPSIEKPFVTLASYPIWELILYKNGEMPKLSIIDIQRKVRVAMLNQYLFDLLTISKNRSLLKDFIIRYYHLKQ